MKKIALMVVGVASCLCTSMQAINVRQRTQATVPVAVQAQVEYRPPKYALRERVVEKVEKPVKRLRLEPVPVIEEPGVAIPVAESAVTMPEISVNATPEQKKGRLQQAKEWASGKLSTLNKKSRESWKKVKSKISDMATLAQGYESELKKASKIAAAAAALAAGTYMYSKFEPSKGYAAPLRDPQHDFRAYADPQMKVLIAERDERLKELDAEDMRCYVLEENIQTARVHPEFFEQFSCNPHAIAQEKVSNMTIPAGSERLVYLNALLEAQNECAERSREFGQRKADAIQALYDAQARWRNELIECNVKVDELGAIIDDIDNRLKGRARQVEERARELKVQGWQLEEEIAL